MIHVLVRAPCASPAEQARLLRLTIGRPAAASRPRLPLTAGKGPRHPHVYRRLHRAQIFVQYTQRGHRDAREHKLRVRGDVPAGEDDAGVDDLGVPEHVHRAHRPHGHVVAAMPAVITVVHREGSALLMLKKG